MERKINNFKKTGKQFYFIGKDSKLRDHGMAILYGQAQTASNDFVFFAICHNTVSGKSRSKRTYVADTQEDLIKQLQAQIKKRRLEWKHMKFI